MTLQGDIAMFSEAARVRGKAYRADNVRGPQPQLRRTAQTPYNHSDINLKESQAR